MKTVQSVDHVVIRFAGDSGDGMQIVGSQFTNTTALLGNDLATFPDFPAEIRAPAGTLAGVSGFQLHFASHDIFTPGDAPEAIIAMNPAALKANVAEASVVYLYLYTAFMAKLKPILLAQLKPGTRIVAYQFNGFGDWKPAAVNNAHPYPAYLWIVPTPPASSAA